MASDYARQILQTRNIFPRKYGVDSKETVTATKKFAQRVSVWFNKITNMRELPQTCLFCFGKDIFGQCLSGSVAVKEDLFQIKLSLSDLFPPLGQVRLVILRDNC
jgi:hypothetical protein